MKVSVQLAYSPSPRPQDRQLLLAPRRFSRADASSAPKAWAGTRGGPHLAGPHRRRVAGRSPRGCVERFEGSTTGRSGGNALGFELVPAGGWCPPGGARGSWPRPTWRRDGAPLSPRPSQFACRALPCWAFRSLHLELEGGEDRARTRVAPGIRAGMWRFSPSLQAPLPFL